MVPKEKLGLLFSLLYNHCMHSAKSRKILTILLFILIVFGLVMLFSAGIVESQKKFNSPTYLLKHQFIFGVLPGLFLFFLVSKIKPKFWEKIALPLLFLAIGLLVLVFIPQFGVVAKGAQRWVDFGFIKFQPSEFLKLALILYLAAWFGQRGRAQTNSWSYSALPFLLVLGFTGALLAFQPDLKTLTIIVLLGGSMYFFSGAKVTHIMGFLLIFAIIFSLLVYLFPYRLNRIKAFWDPSSDIQGVAYHTNQAKVSLTSGGIWGVGYGQSTQKINYLPEPMGDSIFAVIIEELGFVGGAAVLALFILLILTLIRIAKKTNDRFGKLFVLGVSTWITLQVFINVGSIIGLIPLTGVPLPFFSYGSSSLVALLIGLGISIGIAKHS